MVAPHLATQAAYLSRRSEFDAQLNLLNALFEEAANLYGWEFRININRQFIRDLTKRSPNGHIEYYVGLYLDQRWRDVDAEADLARALTYSFSVVRRVADGGWQGRSHMARSVASNVSREIVTRNIQRWLMQTLDGLEQLSEEEVVRMIDEANNPRNCEPEKR